MTGKTHTSCGLLVGALTIEYYQTDLFTSITIMTLAVISSLLPDICHTQSRIGRRFKVLSFCSYTVWAQDIHTLVIIYFYNWYPFIYYSNTRVLFSFNYPWFAFTCYTRYVNA